MAANGTAPIEQIPKDLDTAKRALKWAKLGADAALLNKTHQALYTAICDALTATEEAIAHIGDAPD